MVELRKTPVNKPKDALLWIDDDIVWFDVSVHDSLGVAVIKRLQQLKNVVSNVHIRQCWVQHFEVHVIDMFKNQARGLGGAIFGDIQQLNDIGSSRKVLQDFDFSLDLLLLDRLQDFDHTFVSISYIESSKYFTILSSSNFLHHLVVILITKHNLTISH